MFTMGITKGDWSLAYITFNSHRWSNDKIRLSGGYAWLFSAYPMLIFRLRISATNATKATLSSSGTVSFLTFIKLNLKCVKMLSVQNDSKQMRVVSMAEDILLRFARFSTPSPPRGFLLIPGWKILKHCFDIGIRFAKLSGVPGFEYLVHGSGTETSPICHELFPYRDCLSIVCIHISKLHSVGLINMSAQGFLCSILVSFLYLRSPSFVIGSVEALSIQLMQTVAFLSHSGYIGRLLSHDMVQSLCPLSVAVHLHPRTLARVGGNRYFSIL